MSDLTPEQADERLLAIFDALRASSLERKQGTVIERMHALFGPVSEERVAGAIESVAVTAARLALERGNVPGTPEFQGYLSTMLFMVGVELGHQKGLDAGAALPRVEES